MQPAPRAMSPASMQPAAGGANGDWTIVTKDNYFYYWNRRTNEVSWTPPPGFRQ